MSDEPTPTPTPSLRLKPRLRPDASGNPPPSIPKIAIAQPLDADGVLSAGERKVFTAPAPDPSAEPVTTNEAEAPVDQPKKLTLTPKLTADSKTKRFSVPAASPSSGLKRLPPSMAPTPGVGEDGVPVEDDDSPLGPARSTYAKGTFAAEDATEAESVASGEEPTDKIEPTEISEHAGEQIDSNHEDVSAHDAEAIADDAHDESSAPIIEEPLDTPHPAADVPTRFSPPPTDPKEVGRFKLKPRLSGSEGPSSATGLRPPLPNAAPAAMPPPGIKIVPTAPVGPSSGSLPVKVPLQPRGTPKGTRQVRRIVVKSGRSRAIKFFLITVGSIAAIGLTVGGFIGFRYLSQLEKHPSSPAPEVVAHVPVKKPAAHSAPKEEQSAPQSEAGRLIAKAKAVASAQAEEIDAVTDEATNNADAAHAVAPATQQVAQTHPVAAPTTPTANSNLKTPAAATVSPVPVKSVVHEPEPKKAPPPPSAEFRTLIVNLRVNGVFQGSHPRALLNGRLMNAGEILDQSMLVRFMGVDVVHKQLLFEDGNGSQMQRHY